MWYASQVGAVSDYLCIDLRAALFRVLQLLKYENAGALAHDETVPVLIKWNRSPQRIFRLGKCGQCEKPATPTGVIALSAPPATQMSASLY